MDSEFAYLMLGLLFGAFIVALVISFLVVGRTLLRLLWKDFRQMIERKKP